MNILAAELIGAISHVSEEPIPGRIERPKQDQDAVPDIRRCRVVFLMEILPRAQETFPKYLMLPEKIDTSDVSGEWKCELRGGHNVEPIYAYLMENTKITVGGLGGIEKPQVRSKETGEIEGDLLLRKFGKGGATCR